MKEGIHSFGSLLIGDSLYIIGGAQYSEHDRIKELTEKGKDLQEIFEGFGGDSYQWKSYKSKLSIYNFKLGIWENSPLKFRRRAYHNLHYFDNKIYVLGGKNLGKNKNIELLDNTIEVYDIKSNTIIVDETNPHQAINFASFLKDNYIIIIGGSKKINKDGDKSLQ